jgi:hypothetical protein
VRRDARRSERRGLARDGRVTLRRALGIATALVAGWLLLAGPLSLAPSAARADKPSPSPSASPSVSATAIPTPTPCFFFCTTPTPVGPSLGTAPATPTPTPPPPPKPTAAPTSVPTGYAESIDPQQTQASIPPTTANLAVVPHAAGSGSGLNEWALFAIIVFAAIAGASFFLFFKIR